jgi:hypothetical protein
MMTIDQSDDEGFASSLTGPDVRETVRRQFAVSLAVAAFILAGVALAAMTPASRHEAAAAPHRLAGVQQPILVAAPLQRFASARSHEIELP